MDLTITSPHDEQNYFRPTKALLTKETLIGPVTAVALPSFVDGERGYKGSLAARGPWIELSAYNTKENQKAHKYLALKGDEGGTIHGMKKCVGVVEIDGRQRDLWIFYGGRHVTFVALDPDPFCSRVDDGTYSPFQNLPIQKESGKNTSESYRVDDWIWDVRAKVSLETDGNSFRILVALGLGHNTAYIMDFQSVSGSCGLVLVPSILRKVVCDVRCITYSLNFFGWESDSCSSEGQDLDLAVVVGTVFNEVLVWNALEDSEAKSILKDTAVTISRKPVNHRLVAHEGVIHSVKIGAGGKYIVSTSDDRTVRLWGQKGSPLDVRKICCRDTEYELVWTGYGHAARVWDSAFVSLYNDSQENKCDGIVTVGEDSTIRIWKIDNGQQVATLKGHCCQSVWNVASNDCGTIITGGNDGAAKLWDVDYHLINNPAIDSQTRHDESVYDRFIIPKDEDHLLPKVETKIVEVEASEVPSEQKKKKKQKKPQFHKQTVCGTALYGDPDHRRVMVVTRAGMLASIDVDNRVWKTHGSWSKNVGATDHVVDPSKGSCIAMHPRERTIAVATSKGEVVLSSIENTDHVNRQVFNLHGYPATQSLHWLDEHNLLAFHIKGTVVWWKVPVFLLDGNTELSSTDKPQVRSILTMSRTGLNVGIPMSFHHNKDKNMMFVGDSRGNIAAFDCNCEGGSDNPQSALDVLSFTHKKEYVMGMMSTDNGEGILSVGNDGFVHEAALVLQDGSLKLRSVLRRPVSCLTGISYIWRAKLCQSQSIIVVGGYHGNKFIVWNLSEGYQLLCLDTGGRNRQLELSIEFHGGLRPMSHSVAILNANKNGTNELLLHSHAHQCNQPSISTVSYGVPCHGETILDVAFCKTASKEKALLVSGSNDCTAKLFCVGGGQVNLVTDLPPHESCIRAVCSSNHQGSTSSLLVVSGGKLLSSFYLVDEVDNGSFVVTFLCTNHLQETPAIDQRMNAVDAIPLEGERDVAGKSHLILSGDSDGGLHLAEVSEEVGQSRKNASFKLAQGQRPILSIVLKRISTTEVLACVGNTAGGVEIWVLPGLPGIDFTTLPKSPACAYRGNQAGANSISIAFVESVEMPRVVVATGGDDQAITCSIISLGIDAINSGKVNITIEHIVTAKESCASAIKGVRIAGDQDSGFRLYAVGYDQRLSMWFLKSDRNQGSTPTHLLRFVSSSPVDIKDINSLDCCTLQGANGEEKDYLVAGGEGMEIISFDKGVWKAAKALSKCNHLLITCGAGFSADSGLATYENMPEKYRELCNPLRLVDNRSEFQLFWSRFSQEYREAVPHKGYKILEQWCGGGKLPNLSQGEDGDLPESSPWWIYSSNVDGHFGRSKCFEQTICEIHGQASEFRCSYATGRTQGNRRLGTLWDKWNEQVESSATNDECARDTIPVSCERAKIECPHCALPARPNVLLFHDTDENVLKSISHERERYQQWEARVEEEVMTNDKHLVIIELGAGLNVPAVRNESEEVFNDTLSSLKTSSSTGSVTLIRINPNDSGFGEIKKNSISVHDKAENALLAINNILSAMVE